MAQEVKITFTIDGIEKQVSSVEDLQDALKGVDKQAKKTEKSVEGVSDATKDLGKSAQEAGEAGEGAITVMDEATGGLASRVKNVISGLGKMGKQAITAFKGAVQGANAMGKALIATGIGAIVVALGLIVAYWDDIKGAISGVSSDQKKLLADTQAEAAARQASLDATSAQENSLKLQGKSEREIRDLKIQQTNEVIAATEQVLQQQKQQAKAQEEAMMRNRDIAQNVIRFLTAPITLLLKTVDMMTAAVSKIPGIDIATNLEEGFSGGLANMLFDPEETAAAGAETIAETEKQLAALKNQRDGYILQNQAADDKAREDKLAKDKAAAEEAAAYEAQKAQELADLKKQIREAEANTEAEQRAKALEDLDLYYAELITKAQENGLATDELEASRLEAMDALKAKYAQEDLDRVEAAKQAAKDKADYEKQLEKAVADTKIGVATSAFDTIAGIAGEASVLGKASAVASATMNTYQAATNALANTPAPPPFPQIAAGVAIASGLMNVKKILSTQTPGGGGGGGGSVPTAPTMPALPAFDPTAALASAAGNQAAGETITLGQQSGASSANVIRAYVVSDEMTSQQEADKKINDLARL
jgi:hypothetical protein